MSLHRKTAVVSAFSVAIILSAICLVAPRSGGKQWGVLALGLPAKVSTKNAFQSVSYYILKQTHEPVLRKDDGQNYYSNILKKWSRKIDSSEYEFCPDTSLKFNAAIRFDFPLFLGHIKAVASSFDPSALVSSRNECVSVRFAKGRRGYLEFLTLYENAPTVQRVENIEDGLGKFTVEGISAHSIVLKRKEPVSDGYNSVVFLEYKGGTDKNLQNRNIKDFNMIPLFDVPDWAAKEYFSLNTVELKSIDLIINHPDLGVRKALYNCINVPGLRSALYPQKKDFYDIQTMLPVGMPGAKGGLPVQQCASYVQRTGAPLIFANWNEAASGAVHEFFQGIRKRTGLNMRVVDYKPKDLTRALYSYPRPYTMVVIVLDAVRPNYTAFFEPFALKNGYYDFPQKGLMAAYKSMMDEEDEVKKTAAAVKMAEQLAGQAEVLPLYQNVRKLYYPKELKRLTVGKGFLQYPEVAMLRI